MIQEHWGDAVHIYPDYCMLVDYISFFLLYISLEVYVVR